MRTGTKCLGAMFGCFVSSQAAGQPAATEWREIPVVSSRGEVCEMSVVSTYVAEIQRRARSFLWSGECSNRARRGPGIFVIVDQKPPQVFFASRRPSSGSAGFPPEETRVERMDKGYRVTTLRNVPVQGGYRPTVDRETVVGQGQLPAWAKPIFAAPVRELPGRWSSVGAQSHRLAAFASGQETTAAPPRQRPAAAPQPVAASAVQSGPEVWVERRIFGPGIGSPGSEIYYLYIGQDGPDHTSGSDRKEKVSDAGCPAGRGGWAALVNSHAKNGSTYTVTGYGWACGAATREQAIQVAYDQCRQKSGCDFSKTRLNRTMEIMSAFASASRSQQQYLTCDIRSPVEGQRTAPFWTRQAFAARDSLCESLEPRGLP